MVCDLDAGSHAGGVAGESREVRETAELRKVEVPGDALARDAQHEAIQLIEEIDEHQHGEDVQRVAPGPPQHRNHRAGPERHLDFRVGFQSATAPSLPHIYIEDSSRIMYTKD